MKEDQRLAMVSAATRALDYLKVKPFAEIEEIIKHIVSSSNFSRKKSELKILEVAAANEVLKLKRQNLNLTDRRILEQFMANLQDIFNKTEEGLE